MKKLTKILSLLLTAAMLLGLAACGVGDPTPSTGPTTQPTTRPTTAPTTAPTTEPALDGTVVQTDKGALRGTKLEEGYRFLGVPYAQATERFVAATEMEPWEGIREATEFGPTSPQSGMFGSGGGMASGDDSSDNNCQNLNIWTPGTNDGGKRAVLVWLHGGGMSTGSGNDRQYDGAALSSYGDVVVVCINHRLGSVGFLDLSAYGEKYKYSANAGMTDVVAALEWIRKNIAAFGGDPENVTLFGQSGGGAKVLAMMTSPYAQGLFHRGIIQSGATETLGVTFSSQAASTALTARILEKLDITAENIEDLQTIELSALERAASEALQETADEFQIPAPLTEGFAMEWGPVVDGDFIPSCPVTEESFAAAGRDVDLLIGSNLNEWSMFMGSGDSSQAVQDAFSAAYPDMDPEGAGAVDTLIRLPMLKIMSHKADQNGAKVYAYLFTYGAEGMGSYHGAEIPYVFRNVQDPDTDPMAQLMSQVWLNFAKTGVPSAEALPEWEPYNRDGGATMILDLESRLAHHHDKDLMELLAPDYEYETSGET